eukprot:GFKZ01005078.1.p1 GENE.GFKZ01005078.1~~GFKZ01005078.1.p1  ORF type:complete len:382 (-),score=31.60 GFKZ01005078.1:147-1292(-)
MSRLHRRVRHLCKPHITFLPPPTSLSFIPYNSTIHLTRFHLPYHYRPQRRTFSFLSSLPNEAVPPDPIPSPTPPPPQSMSSPFKLQRRILVGLIMGFVVTICVFSGKWLFALGMVSISLTGLFEYYRMVAAKGHLPAYKMGLCVTAATILSSAISPPIADVVFPVGGTLICIYLLFRQHKIATIADISTTFMGLFYAGYLPSFWVRLHAFAPFDGAGVSGLVANAIATMWPGAVGFGPRITPGSMLVFWTFLAAASADIGAFFVGRGIGRTKLSLISPKKTVEGAVGGFLCAAGVGVLGGWLLGWPLWGVTGGVYGVVVGILGLCGDLFESLFKRDVGWKDSGRLFPGHGGVLDRADSYVLMGPLVYVFGTLVLPFMRGMV